jgi:hypothetical protein
MSDVLEKTGAAAPGFTVFRFDEARDHIPAAPPRGLTEVSRDGLAKLTEAGMGAGAEARVLFSAPGFSLTYAWFKSGFPLFRHSHGPDCLYQVVGGELRLGEETLRKGDGFFLPAGAAYTFQVGPEGVEVLEFRHEDIRDTIIQANNPAYWEKAVETVLARKELWASEPRPL